MLVMRPDCECCDLPSDQPGAVICAFGRIFRAECAEKRLGGVVCLNCGGGLALRPINLLDRFPASAERIVKPDGCAAMLTETPMTAG